jgi:hypothetical protein
LRMPKSIQIRSVVYIRCNVRTRYLSEMFSAELLYIIFGDVKVTFPYFTRRVEWCFLWRRLVNSSRGSRWWRRISFLMYRGRRVGFEGGLRRRTKILLHWRNTSTQRYGGSVR